PTRHAACRGGDDAAQVVAASCKRPRPLRAQIRAGAIPIAASPAMAMMMTAVKMKIMAPIAIPAPAYLLGLVRHGRLERAEHGGGLRHRGDTHQRQRGEWQQPEAFHLSLLRVRQRGVD